MTSTQHNFAPHSSFASLPIVDISGLFSLDIETRKQAASLLGAAARDTGFLYVRGHRVEPRLIENLKHRTQEYFAQTMEQKIGDYIGNSSNHSGYVPEGEEQFDGGSIDHKEAYDIGFDFLPLEGRRPMLGPNQWPALPGFRDDVKAYYDAVLALSNTLFKGFAIALGLAEDAFSKRVTTPPSQLRLVHYPFNPDAPVDRPGIGAHTDYECFTILLPTAPGLEVLNGAGDWIDVPIIDGTFVINIGDMLEVMSNGIYVATSHRVRRVSEERYSFPLFCACDYDTLIEPIAELSDTQVPSRYESLVCGEHLYAQTVQTFAYLKQRLISGKLKLPEKSKALSSFGHKTQVGDI